jgi:hypothetical protein
VGTSSGLDESSKASATLSEREVVITGNKFIGGIASERDRSYSSGGAVISEVGQPGGVELELGDRRVMHEASCAGVEGNCILEAAHVPQINTKTARRSLPACSRASVESVR